MRQTLKNFFAASALAGAMLAAPTTHAFAWFEGANGDASDEPSSPTMLELDAGSNFTTGGVVGPSDVRDFYSFTLESGQKLSAIVLVGYDDPTTVAANDGNRGYIGINAGATGFIPGVETADAFLGGIHLDADIDSDLLAMLASTPLNGSGFSAPLGAGSYTLLIQQTGQTPVNYTVDLQVVPVPPALVLLGSALVGLAVRRPRVGGQVAA